MSKLGKRMKNLKLGKDMSQLKLAKASRLDVTTINELENGHRSPLLSTLKKIATGLGISIDHLIKNETQRPH